MTRGSPRDENSRSLNDTGSTSLRNSILIQAIGISILMFIAIVTMTGSIKSAMSVATGTVLSENPIVFTTRGFVRGATTKTVNNRTIFAFKGIPYAEPPIGNLRFASPLAKRPWREILDAVQDTPQCPQLSNGVVVGNEDCLHLNIFTPQLPEGGNETLLPVLVYVYGGGFDAGGNNSSRYGPGYLLDKDVLLVVPNYRLGSFGFLSTGDETAPGNFGLKDQLLALEWVRANAKYFSGDPDKVTVVGQSAGSASVHLLTLTQRAAGLFRGYVAESGVAQALWAQRPRTLYAKLALRLGEYVGCPTDNSTVLVCCLRQLNVSQILGKEPLIHAWNNMPVVTWSPTVEPDIEGALLPDTVANLLASGRAIDVPCIVGVNTVEGFVLTAPLHAKPEDFNEFLHNFDAILPYLMLYAGSDVDVAAITSAAKALLLDDALTANKTTLFSKITDFASDAAFIYPATKMIEQNTILMRSPTYFYHFDYRGTFSFSYVFTGHASTEDFGTVHCDESIYLFPQQLVVFSELDGEMSREDLAMKDTMVEIWTSFVINGKPAVPGLDAPWEPYSSQQSHLRIGNKSDPKLAIEYAFLTERMRFWKELMASVSLNVTKA